MDLGLSGKVVFITGGSKGIGLACATAFAAEGAKVAICSRSLENIERALTGLPGAFGVTADLTNADEAADVIAKVEASLGPIDVLVNSAGAARRTSPDELTPARWRAAMDAKYFPYINVIDPVIKKMASRKRGAIINIIGAGGKVASPTHLAGGAANAALMLATVGLGSAYAEQGVRVVGVNPSLTETERVSEGLEAEARLHGISIKEARQRNITRLPLGRMATPEEIAHVVLFLASEKASYVTGVILGVDGGLNPIVI
jgi:NAD(P)-dependent dehydrogenase (short-subunit alcohol dehydrogenase family)